MRRRLLILNERDLKHPCAGGAELNMTETARRFVERGYESTLLCSSFPGAAAVEEQNGLRVRRFGNRFTYYARLPPAVLREARVPGTVIIEHFNKLPFCTPLYTRTPLVIVAHHLFGTTAFQQVALPIASAVYLAEKFIPYVYRDAHVVAVSPSTRDDLTARGIPAERIRVVPNGLDHSLYNPAGRQCAPIPTVLWIGRVEPYKHVEFILQALQRLRERMAHIRLVIIGEGQARQTLERQVAQLGLKEHVLFTGFISDAEKVEHIRRSHVLVNTSEKEGWGLTVLEANACGVPAIASEVAGLRDAVRHDVSGWLVPHGDIAALSAAMLRLLTDHAERERLSAGALAWAREFSWEKSADHILEVVEEAFAARVAAPAEEHELTRKLSR